MTKTCARCGRTIDTAHDGHYRCETHGYYLCEDCYRTGDRCPICSGSLQHEEDSFTKRTFEEPGTRGLLGF